MSKIIRGYWDCSYCDSKTIDGLKDECPNCGKRKSDNIKYYMVSSNDVVSEEELNSARIKEEECDGNNKEWVCPYCKQINNYSDEICVACGGNKNESTYEYGDREKNFSKPKKDDSFYEEEKSYERIIEDNPKDFISLEIEPFEEKNINIMDSIKKYLYLYKYFAAGIFSIIILLVLFFPYKETSIVSGFSWNRCISIEELKTFDENGWTLPSEARLQYTNEEVYKYESVLDHYDTKTRQCSRQVPDGYDYSYRDNGNGTFSEVQTQKYRTEYYTEEYQEPVYRQEPIYETKYYYEIDRWSEVDLYESSGHDKSPYWNKNYTLKKNQRDVLTEEEYCIILVNSKNKEHNDVVDFEQWEKTSIGDKMMVTRSILFIYSSEKTY